MSRIREHFSTTALILSVIALVFALMGGAYAASHAQSSKSVAKRGPRGPRGPKGPAGPAGAQGAAGANGKDGANGTNGAAGEKGEKGDTGSNGKSIVAETVSTGIATECNELGGSRFHLEGSASKVYACNGQDGEQGQDGEKGEKGEKGTFGGVTKATFGAAQYATGYLPGGATETGFWAFNTPGTGITVNGITVNGTGTINPTGGSETFPSQSFSTGPSEAWAPISFPSPMGAVGVVNAVHYVTNANTDTVCGKGAGGVGGTASFPLAPPGTLCVFQVALKNSVFSAVSEKSSVVTGFPGALGGILEFTVTNPAEPATGSGTWAVTPNGP